MKWLSRLGAAVHIRAGIVRGAAVRADVPAHHRSARRSKNCGCARSIFSRSSSRATPTQRPVVIVDIDEDSLRKLGQWPWPRTRDRRSDHAADQAAAPPPSPSTSSSPSPTGCRRRWPRTSIRDLDEETREQAARTAEQRPGPGRRDQASRGSCWARPACRPCRAASRRRSRRSAGVAALGGDPKPFLFKFPGLLRNIPILEKAAAGRGLFSIRTERDGIVRRVPMVMQAQGNIMPSLTVRDAAGGDRRQHHSDPHGRGRHQERRRARSRNADRPQRPALGSFRAARSRRATCRRVDVLEGPRRRRPRVAAGLS